MKKQTITNILLIILLAVNIIEVKSYRRKSIPEPPAVSVQDDWDTFITALAWVESRWNDEAVSPKQAVGYLQLTPVIVKDANRILGDEVYTLDSRTDREQSIEIFNIIMDNYNPEHDMQYALKIWNPYAKVSYHRAVMQKYNELKNI